MTYNDSAVFIETNHFTNLVSRYLSDDEYIELQVYLMERPDAGKIIRCSGGIRKLRWTRQGKGKSGGVRIIYYWAKSNEQIFMLTLYSKSEQENITKSVLAQIAKSLENVK